MSLPPVGPIICRACTSKTEPTLSIFKWITVGNVVTMIKDALVTCASVQVSPGDCLPENVCLKCADDLKQALLFKKRCETSDRVLRDALFTQEIKNEVNVEDDVTCAHSEQVFVGTVNVKCEKVKEFDDTFLNNCDSESDDIKHELKKNDEDMFCQMVEPSAESSSITFFETGFHQFTGSNLRHDSKLYQDTLITNEDRHRDRMLKKKINKQLHVCTVCELTFTTKRLLKSHSITHVVQKKYPCNLCDKVMTRIDKYESHLKSHANKMVMHVCETCGKGFATSSVLKTHKLIHLDEKQFLCNVCGKLYSQEVSLKYHLTTHTGLKPDKCSKNPPPLEQRKPHVCEVCGKTFKTKPEITSHMRCHTGEKPFECKVCNKRFARPTALLHHKRIHTGERPYECKECGMRFTMMTILKSHSLIHTGEKPFVCKLCDRAFRQSAALWTHNKLVHKLKKQK